MNNPNLVGRLTTDPELRYTTDNKAYVRMNIAVDRKISKEDKEAGKQSADFISCIFWNKNAENLAKYMKKGSQICVEGQIQVRNFEDNGGVKRYVTEVICDNIHFLESKGSRSESGYSGYNDIDQYDIPQSKPKQEFADEDPFKDIQNAFGVSSDDLPF